jgi:ABC-2 type transport system ATP-binding protein
MQARENDAHEMPRQLDVQWLINATDLGKRYPRRGMEPLQAVKPTSLQVRAGEIFSLLGPNGAGKSTLISMLCGLARPTSGDAQIGGFSIQEQPIEAKRLLGIVPQEVALYDQLSARRNLEFFGALQGLRGDALDQRIDAVLDVIDLRDRQKEKVQTFSGGMKRRVNLAVGLLNAPRVLFLDEPTVGIDPQNRRRILDTVMQLRREQGMTIFYTSHLMEEVQEISDRVAIMDNGEIIAQGSVPELVQRVGETDRIALALGEQQVDEATLGRLRRDGTLAVEFLPANDQQVENELVIVSREARRALPHLLVTLNEAQIDVRSIDIRQPDLEAVFLNLTGRQLRD